jgi:hypothetical protein
MPRSRSCGSSSPSTRHSRPRGWAGRRSSDEQEPWVRSWSRACATPPPCGISGYRESAHVDVSGRCRAQTNAQARPAVLRLRPLREARRGASVGESLALAAFVVFAYLILQLSPASRTDKWRAQRGRLVSGCWRPPGRPRRCRPASCPRADPTRPGRLPHSCAIGAAMQLQPRAGFRAILRPVYHTPVERGTARSPRTELAGVRRDGAANDR